MMKQVKLEELETVNLKAIAYDLMMEKDNTIRNLNLVNQEILRRLEQEKDAPQTN